MPFVITWSNPAGPVSTRRDTPVEALKKALELTGQGFQDMIIIDETETGKVYSPADFGRFYIDTRT